MNRRGMQTGESGHRSRRWVVCLAVVVSCWLAEAQGGETPRQVFMLCSLGREFAPFNIMAGTFRTELASRSSVPVEFHEATLETARSQERSSEEPPVDYLQAMWSSRQLHLIVAGLPSTTHIVAVIGSPPWLRYWTTKLSRNLAAFTAGETSVELLP